MISRLSQLLKSHPVSDADLSAMVDGRTPPMQAALLETHVDECVSCGEKVAELRSLKAVLAALPKVPAPRPFALSPAVAGASRPVGLMLAPAIALSALALLLAVDFAVIGGGSRENDANFGAPAAEKVARDSGQVAAPAATGARTEAATPQPQSTPAAAARAPSLADQAEATTQTPEAMKPAASGQPGDAGSPGPEAQSKTDNEPERSAIRVLEVVAFLGFAGSAGYIFARRRRNV